MVLNVKCYMHYKTMIITNTKDIYLLPRKFYLFSYGANSPLNLSRRFIDGHDHDSNHITVSMHSNGVCIEGYVRVFFGHSKKWKGSVASIVPSDKSVCGIITEITHNTPKEFKIGDKPFNMKHLFEVEAVDSGMYTFSKIASSDDKDIYAFVGDVVNYPPLRHPSPEYLKAIGTLLEYLFSNAKYIEIPVRYTNNKIVSKHIHKPSR